MPRTRLRFRRELLACTRHRHLRAPFSRAHSPPRGAPAHIRGPRPPTPRRLLLRRSRAIARSRAVRPHSPLSSRRVPMSHHGTPTKGSGGRPLIVLQCIKCNKVLSDSSALVFSDERRDVICVKAASHIDVDEKVRARSKPRASSVPSRRVRIPSLPLAQRLASPHLPFPRRRTPQNPVTDGDVEYARVACAQCAAPVGRVYDKTSADDARLRDLIALDRSAVCSYQFGRHAVRVSGADVDPAQAEASGMTNERVERLEEQMVKVENVLVLFNERVGAMESAMRHALRRVDAAVNPTEPVAWGMGPSPGMGGSADRRGSGVGMGMPMLPRERYGDADGSGAGGGFAASPYGRPPGR